MKKALIFHGTLGSPEGNWFPWLQEHLMFEEWQVAAPKMPTPKGQTLKGWIDALHSQITDLNDLNLVIGHSLGATFILRLLERGVMKPAQVILVSAVIDDINNTEYDALNNSFTKDKFDWQKIKLSCDNIILIHGDDDPYVPLSQPEKIADELGATLNLFKEGGHLNTESGFTDFPEVLEFIDV